MSEKLLHKKKLPQEKISKKGLLKFLIALSLITAFLFIPLEPGSFSSVYATLAGVITTLLQAYIKYIVLFIMTLMFLLTFITSVFKPKFLIDNVETNNLFKKNALTNITRFMAFLFTIIFVFNIGPSWIWQNESISAMLEGAETVVIWLSITVFVLPLLMNFGLGEFLGILLQPIMKPIFKVPGMSSISIVTSLFINPAVGIYMADEEYKKGHYSDREAAIIMTTLSIVPIITLIILPVLMGIENEFPKLLFVYLITLFIVGIIMPRIPPLNLLKKDYLVKNNAIETTTSKGKERFNIAIMEATSIAEQTKYSLYESTMIIIELILIIVPFILTWGTLSLIIFEYTSILHFLAYPFGFILGVLGIENGFSISPVLLVGFIEPLIPVMVIKNIPSVETKFILGSLIFVQQVNLVEIGAMIFPSKVSIGLGKLFIIFLLRTLIALPIIIVLTKFIY